MINNRTNKRFLITVLFGILMLYACGREDSPRQYETNPSPSQSQGFMVESESIPSETIGEAATEETNPNLPLWSVQMEALRKTIADTLGDDYTTDTSITEAQLADTYGIDNSLWEDYLGEKTTMSEEPEDTLIIVKPKEGKEKAVQTALEQYRAAASHNQEYSDFTQVVTIGEYVYYFQLGSDPEQIKQALKGDHAGS